MAAATYMKLLVIWKCPYVHCMQLGLKLTTVDYEFIVDMQFKKNEMLLKYNPALKKIPAICGLCSIQALVMAMSDVKLLGARPSPCVNRVMMALKIKSVVYELIEMNPYENPKPMFLVKSNPIHKKIPVLIHADRPICESLIIVEYINDVWTNGLSILPLDPYDRAIARFWAAYIDDKWIPLFQKLRKVKDEEEKNVIIEEIDRGRPLLEAAFVECSKGKGFFNGDTVGYLDIALGSYVGWIRVSESVTGAKVLDVGKAPNLVGSAERLYSKDGGVKHVMLEAHLLLDLFMTHKAYFPKVLLENCYPKSWET